MRRETANSGSDESLLLHYVTERILASVLPPRRPSSSAAHHQHLLQPVSPNGGVVAESASDDHERELIVMLEQKHGKVRGEMRGQARLSLGPGLGEGVSCPPRRLAIFRVRGVISFLLFSNVSFIIIISPSLVCPFTELPIVRPGVVHRHRNSGEIVRALQTDRLVAG